VVEGGGYLKEESFVFFNSFVLSHANFGPNFSIEEA